MQGVTISKWQYKNSSGAWADYPTTSDNTSVTGGTLVVKPAHNVFVNNVAQIRVTTSDGDVYDTLTISKIYDGAKGDKGSPGSAGTGGLSVVLGNENQTLACTSDGKEVTFSKNGKVIYLSAADIDSLLTLQCDVSK